jgi:hypothetical protein
MLNAANRIFGSIDGYFDRSAGPGSTISEDLYSQQAVNISYPLLNDVESWELVSVGEYKNDSTRDSILSKPKEECFESLSMWS